ncbi:hypothetical protein VTK26DRAFT_5620 [Humicola hyalothermophila]
MCTTVSCVNGCSLSLAVLTAAPSTTRHLADLPAILHVQNAFRVDRVFLDRGERPTHPHRGADLTSPCYRRRSLRSRFLRPILLAPWSCPRCGVSVRGWHADISSWTFNSLAHPACCSAGDQAQVAHWTVSGKPGRSRPGTDRVLGPEKKIQLLNQSQVWPPRVWDPRLTPSLAWFCPLRIPR